MSTLTLHDLTGTPFRILLNKHTGEEILCYPPTIKFFESLVATYKLDLEDTAAAMSNSEVKDIETMVKMLSRTLQLMHISMSMVDRDITIEHVHAFYQADEEVVIRFLKEFAQYLPTKSKNEMESVIQPKKDLSIHSEKQRVWIPQ